MRKYFWIPALLLGFQLTAADNSASTGEFVWNELATSNVQQAKDFYGKMFGWEFTDKKMDDMTYTMIKKGGKDFGGIWEIPTEMQNQIPSHWLAYILVDNLDQSVENAVKNGATVVKPKQQVGDMGTFAILKDPAGAHIALWQPTKK